MRDPAAQSDDCYSRISFGTVAGGEEVEGVLGWREGAENRVVFQVWDGPSFAAEGSDLAVAFAAARAGIIRAGFAPRPPSDGGLGDLFANAEVVEAGSPRPFRLLPWLLLAAALAGLLLPALVRADVLPRGATAGPPRILAISNGDGRATTTAITLPQAPALSRSAAAFDKRLHDIAAARDLAGFMALLTDDVLVSFGGSGGKAEFAAEWALETGPGRVEFWATLDRLLAHGGWNEAGTAEYPQRQTYPWFFAAWAEDADAEGGFVANEEIALRAAPDSDAAVVARLPRAAVLRDRTEAGEAAREQDAHGWLHVTAPDGAVGYVRRDDTTPLLGTRLVAIETEQGWRIEAMVAGD